MEVIVKFKTIFFAFLLTIQNMAFAMPGQNLRSVYDSYIYALTVEWDQVDQEELALIRKNFEEELLKLNDQGLLTKEAVKSLVVDEAHDGRISEEVLNSIMTPAGSVELEKLQSLMQDHEAILHDRGANWSGAAFLAYTAYAFLPALLIIGIITNSGRKDLCSLPTNYPHHEPYPCNPNPEI